MTTSDKTKIVQYLNEAHAMEVGLVRVLQEQIAVTPRGRYRSALETHLSETRGHAERIAARRRELQGGGIGIATIVGTAQDVVGQALAFAKTPLDLLRGSGGEEKVLKNAKDACATEALEIATYIALEHVARELGDKKTAALAVSIRGDEEAMLKRIERELPALAKAVVDGRGSYDITETGAADAVRDAVKETKQTARRAAEETKRTTRSAAQETKQTARSAAQGAKRATRQARRVPGAAQAEGAVKGAVASAGDLPIANYESLTAEEIVARLRELSQVDLAKVEVYERKTHDRTTVLERIQSLRGDEPWAGYDDMTAEEIIERLREVDEELAARVRDYERAHKDRATVLRAAQREVANA
jgi:ferritin-like metal-binding protein YciE